LKSWLGDGAKGDPVRKGDLPRDVEDAGECAALKCWLLAALMRWLKMSLVGEVVSDGCGGDVEVMVKLGL
jgi:hypothetical protein